MTRACDLECMLAHLEAVRRYAAAQHFDAHFLSEVEHLAATVRANQEFTPSVGADGATENNQTTGKPK